MGQGLGKQADAKHHRQQQAHARSREVPRPEPKADSLAHVNAHVFAHIVSWAADPFDATGIRALRATCSKAVLAFDIAVHSGWVAIAVHPRNVPHDEAATCWWLDGWSPAAFAEGRRLPRDWVLRLEYLQVGRPCEKAWSAPACVVCETLSAEFANSDPETRAIELRVSSTEHSSVRQLRTRRLTFKNCVSSSAGAALPMKNELIATLSVEDAPGVLTIAHFSLLQCVSLTAVDLAGLSNVTSIGNSFLAESFMLRRFDATGLSGVKEVGSHFLSGIDSLEAADLSAMTSLTVVGSDFLAHCVSLKRLDLSCVPISPDDSPSKLEGFLRTVSLDSLTLPATLMRGGARGHPALLKRWTATPGAGRNQGVLTAGVPLSESDAGSDDDTAAAAT